MKGKFSMFSLKEKIEIQKYIDQKKELYNYLLKYVENTSDSTEDFKNLLDFITGQNYQESREELDHILRLILKVSSNHSRQPDFFSKIEQILLKFENEIKQTFSNWEIFYIFKSCKPIVLFLLQKKIITLDDSIFNYMIEKSDKSVQPYCHFFITEIKGFKDDPRINQIEEKLDSEVLKNYEENRQIGENISPLCTLIRNDSIDEFVEYAKQNNLPLLSTIPISLFETNSFLIEKVPTLIEYASFYGSIQIIQYLKANNVEMTSSLWIYSIHSNKFELIHFLEENKIEPPNNSYEECIEEAIKCHHNNIANYLQSKLNEESTDQLNMIEKVVSCSYRYFNYPFFSNDYNQNLGFYYLCHYNYTSIVNLSLKVKKSEIEAEIINLNNLQSFKQKAFFVMKFKYFFLIVQH